MKGVFKYLYLLIAALPVFAGCSDDRDASAPMPQMAAAFDLMFNETEEGGQGVLDEYFIDGRSVILISQRGDNLSILFTETAVDNEGNESPNKNLYQYVYYTNPLAEWDNNYYNFQPYGNRALDWAYIAEYRLNGEYALGALYYPIEYNILNAVEQDQRNLDNLRRSNVLGAWHRTQGIETRLRFAFFHLMTAIKVTLLIPDWDPVDNSGFGDNAILSGDLLNVIKDFTVDWPVTSSEVPPNAQYRNGVDPCDIQMYLEQPLDNTIWEIKYSDLTSSFPEIEERVRKATFFVLFPPQQLVINGPAMRFKLRTMSGMEKSYVWNTTNLVDNPLLPDGGRVNSLMLYLPRKENNAILIKASILDWIEADSQVTVIPDDDKEE